MFKKANAETCEKCPHRYDSAGCPCWISKQAGFMKTNVVTGEEQFIEGCFYQIIPFLMIEIVKASNRPAAAVESIRNDIVHGMSAVARCIHQFKQETRLIAHEDIKAIDG